MRVLRRIFAMRAAHAGWPGPGLPSWLSAATWWTVTVVPCSHSSHAKQARKFLAYLGEPLDAALRELDAGRVTSFIVGYCRDRNPESAKALVTAVRALLRFLPVAGHVPVPLAAAVPAVAGWPHCPAGWTPR